MMWFGQEQELVKPDKFEKCANCILLFFSLLFCKCLNLYNIIHPLAHIEEKYAIVPVMIPVMCPTRATIREIKILKVIFFREPIRYAL